jgi:hypothetical protein
MITQVNPNDATAAYTSRNDAVKAIRDIIAEAGGDVDDYGIDAIADAVLGRQGHGYMTRFFIASEDDEFWAAVTQNTVR